MVAGDRRHPRDSESGWRSLNNMYKTEDMLLAMPSSMRTVLASAQRSTARTSSSILGVWHRRCQHGILRSENQQESEPTPMPLSSDMLGKNLWLVQAALLEFSWAYRVSRIISDELLKNIGSLFQICCVPVCTNKVVRRTLCSGCLVK